MAMLRREIRDERRENGVILSGAVRRGEGSKAVMSTSRHCEARSCHSRRRVGIPSLVLVAIFFLASAAFAAPKSASAYYGDAAFQYIENRLPTAEITCNEGLQYYPNDQKLQMLLDRIHEAKDEQKNENKKNDPKNDQNQDQNNQDQNQDQDKQNQDQNKDQQNQQNQDQQNQNQNGDQSSSSSQNDQNQDKQDQGQNGGQSSSSQSQSSDSNGGAGEQPQQPEQSEGNSSDSNGSDQEQQQPLAPGELTPEEAAQLLKDFDEQNGERKPWKPVRGQVRPAKDW